jgi:hypothetical protein
MAWFFVREATARWLYPACDMAIDQPRLQSKKSGRYLMPVNCATLIVSQNHRLNVQQAKKTGALHEEKSR